MTGLELLETHPKSAEVIKKFYHDRMLKSLNADNTIPEDFKEMFKSQEFDNEYIAKFIDDNPRFLFDVFDAHGVYIQINVPKFSYSINEGDVIAGSWETRKEAEVAAVEQAFEILNNKL